MKIFCIGLSKTGTRSLHVVLERLGFKSLHWGGPANRLAVERAIDDQRPLLEYLGDYDAFSDILVLSTNFDVLDREYPGSKFILTTRDLDSWLDSRRRHVERNVTNKAAGSYSGLFLSVDLEAWAREKAEHEDRVRKYFATRPDDLLVMDIVGGDGWEPLCAFLGCAVPDAPFPLHR